MTPYNSFQSPESRVLLGLHGNVPEFNMRNVCEALCLLEGEKPVMRLVAPATSVPFITDYLLGIGINTAVSSWCLRTSYTTNLGDTYTINTTREGHYSEFLVVTASLDQRLADQCLDYEEDGRSPEHIGNMLGYPKCCVEAYERISSDNDWLAAILVTSPLCASHHYGANRLSYIFSERSLFYDYFPCSLDCDATHLITHRVGQILSGHGMTDFVESIRKEMQTPIILRGGILIYLRGGFWDNDHLVYDLSQASLHGWRVRDGADYDFVWSSNNLIRHNGKIDFFRDRSFLGTCVEKQLDNRLLVFTGDEDA